MKVNPTSSSAALVTSPLKRVSMHGMAQGALESLSGSQIAANQGWSDIVGRLGQYMQTTLRPGISPISQIDQLSGLLKLQVDVNRYQLRVELASKVSESAVASMRKLQQNQ
jgi:hypothetical protein